MKRSSRRIIVQNCRNSENEKIKSAEMSLSAYKKDDQSMSVRVPGDGLVSPTVTQKRRSKHVQALYGKRKKVTLDQKALRHWFTTIRIQNMQLRQFETIELRDM